MEYYLVKQDTRIENGILISPAALKPESHAVTGVFSRDRRFLDYYEGERLLVSEELKLVLEKYNNKLVWHVCAFVDTEKQEQKVYFFTEQVPVVSCISEKTEYNKRRQVRHLVLERSKIGGCRYFYVRNNKEQFLIFRQDVAESILRRNFYGISLERAAIVTEGVQLKKQVI